MEPSQTWVSEPDRLLQVLISAIAFYVYIVALMRLSGKRTAGNMNNFDWIINVAIGSIIASGILVRDVSMLDAGVAVTVLAALQWATTWATLRSRRFARLIKPTPRLLLRDGAFLEGSMLAERITEDEIKSALRRAGVSQLETSGAVVIETNGQLSVMRRGNVDKTGAGLLEGVQTDTGVVSRDDRGGPAS